MLITESRYDRAERISWWDQEALRRGRVLVVGAGALGNEAIKNLVLVGVGSIDVIDMDQIEYSNLSRCVFFRDGDEGKFKSEVVAERANLLNPDVNVKAFTFKVQKLGSGILKNYDVVISALDNREARLWLSRASLLTGVPVIDGAIEGLQGLVRIFNRTTPCYACGLTEVDWKILNHRRSCALITKEDFLSGKTPTNATTSSVVSAIQVQEAIKYLVGREDLVALEGKAWHFHGENMASYVVELPFDDNCVDHVEIDEWIETAIEISKVGDFFSGYSDETVVMLSEDFVIISGCDDCGTSGHSGVVSQFGSTSAICDSCDKEMTVNSKSIFSITDFIKEVNSDVEWPIANVVQLIENGKTNAVVVMKENTNEN